MSAELAYEKRSLYYGWLPKLRVVHKEFLRVHIRQARAHPLPSHQPAVEEFANAIRQSTIMSSLFDSVFDQVNKDLRWQPDDPDYHVQSFDQLLDVLDTIVDAPPRFYKVKSHGQTIGEPIGVPIYLVFDLLSNTSAAYDLFRLPEFNVAMKNLLNSWGAYLKTEGSNSTLNKGPEGWFSEAALAVLESGLGKWSFNQTYQLDPVGDYPYKSWDDFFVREFKPLGPDGKPLRPVLLPGFPVIYSPCESTVFRTATNVKRNDTFWLKTQNYSIFDMLGGRQHPDFSVHADDFVGGVVYQSFLAPQDYHRWHSPIEGKVSQAKVFEGTYYAVLPDDGAPDNDPDLQPGDPHGALIRSQPWLSVAATRAVFIIESTDPNVHIKKVAFLAIGMVEVSTCQITAPAGTEVKVGDELGMFHFGGSTYALIIQLEDGYEVLFQDIYDTPIRPGQHRWINSIIGHVRQKKIQ